MTIWLYALCGQEAQMLHYFMRHYAPEVDRLILLDGSMDEESRAIAYEYPNAEIQPSPYTNGGYDDERFVKYAAAKYQEARRKADWVIWVDIDEFLYSGKPLRETLDGYRAHEILAVQCEGFQMVAPVFPDGYSLTDLVKVGAYDKIYNKVAAFSPELTLRWSPGRHSCAIDGLEPTHTGMKLLHYRYFGDEWLKERNARNWARRSEEDAKAGRGYHGAPDYTGGRYSAEWFKAILDRGQEVI